MRHPFKTTQTQSPQRNKEVRWRWNEVKINTLCTDYHNKWPAQARPPISWHSVSPWLPHELTDCSGNAVFYGPVLHNNTFSCLTTYTLSRNRSRAMRIYGTLLILRSHFRLPQVRISMGCRLYTVPVSATNSSWRLVIGVSLLETGDCVQ